MSLILADTSIWIELLRKSSKIKIAPETLLQLATCPPIIQEVIQGLRPSPESEIVRQGLLSMPCLCRQVSLDLYIKAAKIYSMGRQRGLTIRSSIDCLIAAIAIENKVRVWHKDRDFNQIIKYTDLMVYRHPTLN